MRERLHHRRDPAGPVARFEFTADEDATFECALDKGGYLPCQSPKRFNGLDRGRHLFRLRATDANGNLSALVSQRWRVIKN